MVYTLRFFSSKCSLFHNSNLFGSYIIHILYTGCFKIKKKSDAKRLNIRTQSVLHSKHSPPQLYTNNLLVYKAKVAVFRDSYTEHTNEM